MLDQTEVKPTNGHTELPPRAMARSTAELLHDMVTLAELQGKLALLDLREGFAKLLAPVALVAVAGMFRNLAGRWHRAVRNIYDAGARQSQNRFANVRSFRFGVASQQAMGDRHPPASQPRWTQR